MNPLPYLKRVGQVQWDHYYMAIARTVSQRANCTGSKVGAVLVRGNRIVSTGFNGTPEGFQNCLDGGCVRCWERYLRKTGRHSEIPHPAFPDDAKALDLCICVHAEANAFLAAARAGIHTDGTTLYVTHRPCFVCLKEAVQAGVVRVVYLNEWRATDHPVLIQMYKLLAEHLRRNDQRNFERLCAQSEFAQFTAVTPKDPNLDDVIGSVGEASMLTGPIDDAVESSEPAVNVPRAPKRSKAGAPVRASKAKGRA